MNRHVKSVRNLYLIQIIIITIFELIFLFIYLVQKISMDLFIYIVFFFFSILELLFNTGWFYNSGIYFFYFY